MCTQKGSLAGFGFGIDTVISSKLQEVQWCLDEATEVELTLYA
jgi:hypothetical protein